MLKKWADIIDHDEEFSDNEFSPHDEADPGLDDDVEMADSDDDVKDVTMSDQNTPQNVQKSSTENGLPPGYFNVEAILRHKFDQGWKFLTKWENFPMSASSWEPIKALHLGKNKWNEVFAQYCNQKGLQITPKGTIKEREDPSNHTQKTPTME